MKSVVFKPMLTKLVETHIFVKLSENLDPSVG